ncbi:hypothetical protein [Umezawaea sp. Da 62-37]|uniref:hypothetical protein n=1 Tax=Umezawaea sp. Da 62-37 TaxID=3075927 RepID=UPI0028F6EE48|nr:hypothetical protein [Umezawaea sp. Da 62-37]WNV88939.1 hypothetical protein RM788_11735 [Umezawaea sp. Da 62-37]
MLSVATTNAGVPGVVLVEWDGERDRLVLAHAPLARQEWLQLADVVLCAPQEDRAQARAAAGGTLSSLPGATVVMTPWGCHRCLVLVRGGEEAVVGLSASDASMTSLSVWIYSRVVFGRSLEELATLRSSPSSKDRTCSACGPDERA